MGALRSACALLLLGEHTKVIPQFLTPKARKTAKRARFEQPTEKNESTTAAAPKFRFQYPFELFGLIHKWPGHNLIFAENLFSPADESVFMGLVVRSGDGVLRALAG